MMTRKLHLSLSEQKKLSHYKYFVKLLCTTDRTKARKILKQVMDANPKFGRFCSKINLLEMKQDQILELVGRYSSDDHIMLGFIVIFQKIEELRMVEIQKENNKIQDEILFYTQTKSPNDKGVYRISQNLISPSYTNFMRANIAEDLSQFQQKYGTFDRISKRCRLVSKIIDTTYQKLYDKMKSSAD